MCIRDRRIGAAAAAGFKAIELQFPYDVPASQVKAAIERNKLTILGVNTPPGERDGEFGLAAVPGHEKDWQALFARALDYISSTTSMPSTSRPCFKTRAVKSHNASRESRVAASSAFSTGQFS